MEEKKQTVETVIGEDGKEREIVREVVREVVYEEKKKKINGVAYNLISCGFSLLGLFTIGFIFVPIGALIAIAGSIDAVKAMARGELFPLFVAILAWACVVVGFIYSPILWGLVGLLFLPQS